MSAEDEARQIIDDQFEKGRDDDLHDRRIALVYSTRSASIPFCEALKERLKEEKSIGRAYTGHSHTNIGREVEAARRALKKIQKAAGLNSQDDEISFEISGEDVLALQKFAVEVSRGGREAGILRGVAAVSYVDRLGEQYLENPHKKMPASRFDKVRKIVDRAFSRKTTQKAV